MESQHNSHQLKVIFLPFPAPGHMNPMVDIARLFAKHGVSVTIITTYANALTFQKTIDSDFSCGYPITTQVLPFPAAQVGLPDGLENFKDCTSPEMLIKIRQGMSLLKDQAEFLLQDLQPDCIVTDMLYPWTVNSAAKLGIPRIFFYSSSYFSNYASYCVWKYNTHERLVSGTNKSTIPGLPESVEMTTLQLAEWVRSKIFDTKYLDTLYESEVRSYGALYNSFHELESDYEQLYESTIGIKSWSVGPVSTWIKKYDAKKANIGHMERDLVEEAEWLIWLNSKQNESVLYVTFGSITRLPHSQLVELAIGLENSSHDFILVIRKKDVDDEDRDNFLQDFEQKMKESNKGYIIWNWAPQLVILDHPAIGGIMTHCGWNSTLETLNAGLPIITWPMSAEQFYNEVLLNDVLKVGVPVRSKENKLWESMNVDGVVTREDISKAVVMLMGREEESREMRKRAKQLGDAANKSIEEGGSSFNNLMQLLDGLKSLKISKTVEKMN